jgi:hypothetical protein
MEASGQVHRNSLTEDLSTLKENYQWNDDFTAHDESGVPSTSKDILQQCNGVCKTLKYVLLFIDLHLRCKASKFVIYFYNCSASSSLSDIISKMK